MNRKLNIASRHFSLVAIYLVAIAASGCTDKTVEPPVSSPQNENADSANSAPKENSGEDADTPLKKSESQIKTDSNFQDMLANTLVDIYFKTEDYRPPSSFNLLLTNQSKAKILADVKNEIRQLYDEDLPDVAKFIQTINDLQSSPSPKVLNDMVEGNDSIKWLIEKVDQAHFRHSMQ